MANNRRNLKYCSFCGRGEDEVDFLIPSATGLLLCNYCLDAFNEIVEEHLHGHGKKKAAESFV